MLTIKLCFSPGNYPVFAEKLRRNSLSFRTSITSLQSASISEVIGTVFAETQGCANESSKDEPFAEQKDRVFTDSLDELMDGVAASSRNSFTSSSSPARSRKSSKPGGVPHSVKYKPTAKISKLDSQVSGADRYARASSVRSSRKTSQT